MTGHQKNSDDGGAASVGEGEEKGAPFGAPRRAIIPIPSPDGQRRRPGSRRAAGVCHRQPGAFAGVTAYSSSGNSFSSASENTGPSTQTYLGPTLHLPQMPMPHFILFSRVV